MNEIRIANFKNTFNNRVSVQCTSINRFDFLPPVCTYPIEEGYWLKKAQLDIGISSMGTGWAFDRHVSRSMHLSISGLDSVRHICRIELSTGANTQFALSYFEFHVVIRISWENFQTFFLMLRMKWSRFKFLVICTAVNFIRIKRDEVI